MRLARLAVLAAFVMTGLGMPLAAGAQSASKTPRIGLLSLGTDPSRPTPPQWLAFFEGLHALGWIEDRNILVERRFAAGKSERAPAYVEKKIRTSPPASVPRSA